MQGVIPERFDTHQPLLLIKMPPFSIANHIFIEFA